MTVADLAKLVRTTSLALPIHHPDQAALQEAHEALMSAPSITGSNVVRLPVSRPDHQPTPPSAA